MEKVSIIIPVYNNERYVEKCIRSIMNQTYGDLEILIVDDGSTDGSGEILEKLAAQDKRIRLFHQNNGGVASARNAGLDAATGTYVTFVDGDDYLERDYIEKFYYGMKGKGAEMVVCGLTYVDEAGRCLREIVPGEYRRFEHEEWMFRISAVASHFYLRRLWEDNGIRFRPGERGEDLPISLFFSTICDKITTIPDSGYYYVQHKESARHNFRGLRSYSPPYHALEETIQKIQSMGGAASPEFYELYVLRILSTCLFQLSPGASKEKMKELCDYIMRILETYFPNYYRNKKAGLFSGLEIPFTQRAAVKILIFLVRTRLLYPAADLLSKL